MTFTLRSSHQLHGVYGSSMLSRRMPCSTHTHEQYELHSRRATSQLPLPRGAPSRTAACRSPAPTLEFSGVGTRSRGQYREKPETETGSAKNCKAQMKITHRQDCAAEDVSPGSRVVALEQPTTGARRGEAQNGAWKGWCRTAGLPHSIDPALGPTP